MYAAPSPALCAGAPIMAVFPVAEIATEVPKKSPLAPSLAATSAASRQFVPCSVNTYATPVATFA
jgi:hypothetical protein